MKRKEEYTEKTKVGSLIKGKEEEYKGAHEWVHSKVVIISIDGKTKVVSNWDSTINPIKFRRSGRQVGSLISQLVNKKGSEWD